MAPPLKYKWKFVLDASIPAVNRCFVERINLIG